eukprot:GGOE01001157.1.p1 GENE.GGOE01001157.1~~GGOE01001157.1.p1  ORF type:complete len:416 (+),score=55.53 GGOE01001157.1:109-1356(+)
MAFQPVLKRKRTLDAVGLEAALDSEATPARTEPNADLARKLNQAFNVALPEAQLEATKDHSTSSHQLPWSWVVHTKLRVTSPSPFSWCSPANNAERPPDCSKLLSDMLVECTYHKHPAFHVAQAVDPPEFHAERGREWVTALLSVYRELCGGRCPYFYVLRDGAYSMLFLSGRGSHMPCKERCVLVAGATMALRRSLEEQGIEIDTFEPPGPCKDDEESVGAERLAAEREVHRRRNLLWLRGRSRAHLLVQWLLRSADVVPYNRGGGGVEQKGPTFNHHQTAPRPVAALPTLLAPVPFRHASTEALKLRNCGGSVQFVDSKETQMHDLEVEGAILPSALQSLMRALASTQAAGFHTSVLRHHPSTTSFGVVCPTVTNPEAASSTSELHPNATGRLMARVAHCQGTFTITFAPTLI